MDVTACLLVGIDAQNGAVARRSLAQIFPESTVKDFRTLAEAIQSPTQTTREILVLANPTSEDLAKAQAATDGSGRSRWAIIVLGTPAGIAGAEMVSPKDWTEPVLAHVFQAALVQHALRRENAQLRGDLRTMAYRVSHDLRTPLGGIVMAGEMVKEVLGEKDPSAGNLAKPIFNSTDDLMSLIDRVSFALKATVNPQVKKPVAMKDVVWAALQRLERRTLKAGATVTQPDDWPEVLGVAAWLEAIWCHLLANALQHGGTATRISLGWKRIDSEHQFWIHDSGPGVPAEKREHLFQRFDFMHQPQAAHGLGLSLVRRLVELQGGRCGYEPPAAAGPGFFFTLPGEQPAKM